MYDGNGMFKSLGNILLNPYVGLLFIDFEHPDRLRINGRATLHDDDPLLSEYPDTQLLVRIQADYIFPNCPRYIHKMRLVEHSVHVPRLEYTTPVPQWKKKLVFRGVLPRMQKKLSTAIKVASSTTPATSTTYGRINVKSSLQLSR